MNGSYFSVDDYLIQEGRMRLIDAIVDVDQQGAIARSVTTGKWPLFENGRINPIVIVELVAQTAGVCIRWQEMQKQEVSENKGGGFIVGVKEAAFFVGSISTGATITTCAMKKYVQMNYAEYHGFSKIGGDKLGEVTLQVFRTD